MTCTKIFDVAEQLSNDFGLSIEICLEGIGIFLEEQEKGKFFEESAQIGVAFLNEKRQSLCTTITTAARVQNSHQEV